MIRFGIFHRNGDYRQGNEIVSYGVLGDADRLCDKLNGELAEGAAGFVVREIELPDPAENRPSLRFRKKVLKRC